MNYYSDYRMNNNWNFNQCNYNQKDIKPKDLYDPYQGFIRGNLFPDLYNTYQNYQAYNIEPMNEQARLLTYVDSLEFASHDLNLYLDTHPNDREMIQLFQNYQEEAKKAVGEYESKYGPLYVSSNTLNKTPWAWNDLPWPWEYR